MCVSRARLAGRPPCACKRRVAPSTCLPANRLSRPACNCRMPTTGIPDPADMPPNLRGRRGNPCASSRRIARQALRRPPQSHAAADTARPRAGDAGSRGADALRRAEPVRAAAARWSRVKKRALVRVTRAEDRRSTHCLPTLRCAPGPAGRMAAGNDPSGDGDPADQPRPPGGRSGPARLAGRFRHPRRPSTPTWAGGRFARHQRGCKKLLTARPRLAQSLLPPSVPSNACAQTCGLRSGRQRGGAAMRSNRLLLKWLCWPEWRLFAGVQSAIKLFFRDRAQSPLPRCPGGQLTLDEMRALRHRKGDTPQRYGPPRLVAQVRKLRNRKIADPRCPTLPQPGGERTGLRQRERSIEQRIQKCLGHRTRPTCVQDREQKGGFSERQQAQGCLQDLQRASLKVWSQGHPHRPGLGGPPESSLGLEEGDWPALRRDGGAESSPGRRAGPPKAAAAVADGFSFPNDFSPAGGTWTPASRNPRARHRRRRPARRRLSVSHPCPSNSSPEWDRSRPDGPIGAGFAHLDGTVEHPYPFKVVNRPDTSAANGIGQSRMWPCAVGQSARPSGLDAFPACAANPLLITFGVRRRQPSATLRKSPVATTATGATPVPKEAR